MSADVQNSQRMTVYSNGMVSMDNAVDKNTAIEEKRTSPPNF